MKRVALAIPALLAIAPAGLALPGEFGAQQVISPSPQAANVHTVDLDGDGDLDVLSGGYSSTSGYRVVWHENLGGGSFGPQQIISHQVNVVSGVFAIDLDGDTDADVLSASEFDDKIAWYENLGGGAFGPQQVITTEADKAKSVFAIDLDGDGDADVLSASYNDKKIAWYENLGGGAFGPQQLISSTNSLSLEVLAADLDDDGDADVIALKNTFDSVTWYENLGGGVFGPQRIFILHPATESTDISLFDLEGDGDTDIVCAVDWANPCQGSNVGYLENLGGGNFAAWQAIETPCVASGPIAGADLDGDGDGDILSTAPKGIWWYQNLGGGAFDTFRVISSLDHGHPYTADLDGDGDADVLTSYTDKLVWHENIDGGVTVFCTQTKPTSVTGCVPSLSAPNISLESGIWTTYGIPRDFSLGLGTVVGTYIYTSGVGTGASTVSMGVPFGTLCLSGFARSGPVALPGAVAGYCNPGPMKLSLKSLAVPPVAVGEDVNVQLWYRDPLPGNSGNAGFSNAIFYTLQ